MVFGIRDLGSSMDFLPKELARLHAFGLDLTDEWALAPYAIDDGTDQLFERQVEPTRLLWLAADNANALYWGLHDWSHFHNHGPFEERAWTEAQCDLAALAWMQHNRFIVPMDDGAIGDVVKQVSILARDRFEAEGKTPPIELFGPDGWLTLGGVDRVVAGLGRS
jgi:hypothetical protein